MKAIGVVIFSLFSISASLSQSSEIDSLVGVLESTKQVPAQLEILEELSVLAGKYDYQQALIFAKRGWSLAKESSEAVWHARFSESTGRMHANLGHLDSAETYFTAAFDGYTKLDDQKGIATTLFKIAWLHQRRGEFDQGMQANMQALRIMEALGDKAGIANALGRVADDLYNQEKPAESLEYAQRAMDICREGGYNEEMPYLLYSAGYASIGLEKYEEALAYFDEAIEWVASLGLGKSNEADMRNGRGNALKKLERYEEATIAYQKTLSVAEEANYYGGIFTATANLGEVLLRQERYEEALSYQLRTIEMQEDGEASNGLTENYGHVSTIYEQLGDYKNALLYQKKAREMRDRTASALSDKAMSELRTQYETEQKEATIALQQAEISQQRQIQWLSFGLVGLLAIFAMSFYRNALARKKINALLSAKNDENELLLKEIHHRVKNNLEVVSSLLALQSAQIDDPKVKDAMLEGQNRVHSIGIVHQKLYQGTNIAAVEMKDYFINLSDSILDTFGADDRVTIECAMNQLELDIDTAVPLGLIVNELLTNALKYAFPDGRKGKIRIEMNAAEDASVSLKIADDGIGISGAAQGTGFGSQLVALLTRQLDGSMRQEANEGTIVYLDFRTKRLA